MSQAPQVESSVSLPLTITILGGVLAVAFEAYGTLTAMPAAAQDLGNVELYAWAFTGFVLAQVLAIVLAGRLVDKIGPIIPLAAGFGIFTVGLALAGLAPAMQVLLLGRMIQGFGGGALNLALMVVVAQAYDAKQRANLMSALSFCWVLPSFIGPPISAWVTKHFSWHWVFLGIVPFLLILIAIGAKPMIQLHNLRQPNTDEANPVPIWAAFAGAVGTGLLQLGGQLMNFYGLLAAIAGIVVLLVGIPFLMPPGFMQVRTGLAAVVWTRGLAGGSFFAAESFLPLVMGEIYNFTLGESGLFLALGATGWTLGSMIQAWNKLKLRRDTIITYGAVLELFSLCLMSATAWLALPWIVMGIGFTLSGCAMGLVFSCTSLAIMQLSPEHYMGRNMSSLQVAEGLGNSVVTGAAGTIFATLHASAAPTTTFGPIYLLGAIASVLMILTSFRIGSVRNESSGVG